MKLWMSPTSPYSRKVRIVLREKQIPCEEVVPAEARVDIGGKNPLGKIPTLELPDGTLLFDSVVIAEYVDTLSDAPRMIPAEPLARAVVRRWEALGDGIADAVVIAMLERRRAAEKQDGAVVKRQHGKVRAALEAIERQLSTHGALVEGAFTLADAAVLSGIGYARLRAPELLEAPYPALEAYVERCGKRPSVRATRPIG